MSIEIEDTDIELEVLSSIPRFPSAAHIDDLTKDFAITKPVMKKILDGLKSVGVNTYDTATGLCAYVRSDAWVKVQRITSGYWKNRYGE